MRHPERRAGRSVVLQTTVHSAVPSPTAARLGSTHPPPPAPSQPPQPCHRGVCQRPCRAGGRYHRQASLVPRFEAAVLVRQSRLAGAVLLQQSLPLPMLHRPSSAWSQRQLLHLWHLWTLWRGPWAVPSPWLQRSAVATAARRREQQQHPRRNSRRKCYWQTSRHSASRAPARTYWWSGSVRHWRQFLLRHSGERVRGGGW